MSEKYQIAADAFRTSLQVDVDRNTNFFSAGGDSLRAAEMLRGLRESSSARPKLGEFMLDPTPVGLARQLERGE